MLAEIDEIFKHFIDFPFVDDVAWIAVMVILMQQIYFTINDSKFKLILSNRLLVNFFSQLGKMLLFYYFCYSCYCIHKSPPGVQANT